MIPTLYGKTENNFTYNGIGFLIDATKCIVTEERNGSYECLLQYPITGQWYAQIEDGCIIKAKASRNYSAFTNRVSLSTALLHIRRSISATTLTVYQFSALSLIMQRHRRLLLELSRKRAYRHHLPQQAILLRSIAPLF
mgnify:CR=1 FL=1